MGYSPALAQLKRARRELLRQRRTDSARSKALRSLARWCRIMARRDW